MEGGSKYCLICGKEMATGAGIDSHIKSKHKLDYDFYRKWFADAEGSYSVYDADRKDGIVLTITRTLRTE